MYTPLCLVLLCYTVLFTQLNRIPLTNTARVPERIMNKAEEMKEHTLMLGLGVTTVLFTGIQTPLKKELPKVFATLLHNPVQQLKKLLPVSVYSSNRY